MVEIAIAMADGVEQRLDGFLARQLGLSRGAIARLWDAKCLRIQPQVHKG
jgi:hypothetical protein